MGDDADRDSVGAARRRASLRLSRLLQVRLLDQRQAERADYLDPARDPCRRRDPRSGDGRAHRDRPRRRATGVHYHREGKWRHQRAKNVVVAGYAIETPRLLLNSACEKFPDGLANSSGLVGKYFMPQSNHAVYGTFEDEIRWYKGPPSLAITEHWNYTDHGKDFPGGYVYMSQGPLAVEWAQTVGPERGLWGMELRNEMAEVQPYGRAEDRRRGPAEGEATGSNWPTRPTNTGCASRA